LADALEAGLGERHRGQLSRGDAPRGVGCTQFGQAGIRGQSRNYRGSIAMRSLRSLHHARAPNRGKAPVFALFRRGTARALVLRRGGKRKRMEFILVVEIVLAAGIAGGLGVMLVLTDPDPERYPDSGSE